MMPRGSGTVPVIVTAGGQQSIPMMVNYNEPVISSIEPSHGPTQGGTLVTLTGTDFGTAGTVTVGGNPGSIDLWTDTSVSFLTPAGQGVTRPVILSTGGQDSNPMAFNYDPPVISSMVPLSFPTGGGASITLNGNNFGSSMPDTTVTAVISGVAQPLPVVSVDHGQLVCVSPTGEGTDNTLSVTISGQTSNSLPFSFGPPVIDSMDINHGPTEGGTLVTLTGQNFGLAPAVTLGGTNCPLNGNSHTQISFYTPQGQGTSLPVIVAAAGQTSNAVPFSYDAPVINNIEPSIGPTGGGTTVFLTGINFGASGTIMFNGSPVASQTWTNTLVSFLTPSGEGISLPVFLTVGGQTSNVVSFSYSPPVINAINPAGGRTEGGYPVTLSGSSFGSSGTLSVGGNIVAPSSWTHNSVEFAMPPGQGTNIPIYLTVSGAQSNTVHFSYSPPSITGVVPSLGPTIGGTPLTISGDNFGMSGAVTVGGIPCSVQSWSHTQVTALSPEGQGAGLPVIVAVAGQHSNSTPFSYLPPVISTIVPSEGPEAGGNLIALTGTDFGTTGSVTINGNPGTVQSWSHTEITFLAPAGSGQNLSVRVMSGGQLSNSVFYSYYGAPVLTLIDPSTGGLPAASTLRWGGQLGTGGDSVVGGNDAAPLAWTNNWIQFTMPEGQGANVPVHVVVNGQPSNQLFFSYLPPSVISSVPTNGTAAGGTLVTVNGENFGTGGTVLVTVVPEICSLGATCRYFPHASGEGVCPGSEDHLGRADEGTYGLFLRHPARNGARVKRNGCPCWTTSDSLLGTRTRRARRLPNLPGRSRGSAEPVFLGDRFLSQGGINTSGGDEPFRLIGISSGRQLLLVSGRGRQRKRRRRSWPGQRHRQQRGLLQLLEAFPPEGRVACPAEVLVVIARTNAHGLRPLGVRGILAVRSLRFAVVGDDYEEIIVCGGGDADCSRRVAEADRSGISVTRYRGYRAVIDGVVGGGARRHVPEVDLIVGCVPDRFHVFGRDILVRRLPHRRKNGRGQAAHRRKGHLDGSALSVVEPGVEHVDTLRPQESVQPVVLLPEELYVFPAGLLVIEPYLCRDGGGRNGEQHVVPIVESSSRAGVPNCVSGTGREFLVLASS